jgi:TonB family protein
VIDSGEILEFSAMVKVSVLAIALFGLVPLASPAPYFQQQDGQQSGQQQGGVTAPKAGQLRVCDSNAPINCHAVDGVTAPRVLYAPDPELTRLERKKKLNGISVVGLVVGDDGKPYDVHLVHSMPEGVDQSLQPAALELDQKAIEAVQRYKFKPATYQGKPVPVEVKIEVRFVFY